MRSDKDLASLRDTKLYASVWIKLSSNFQGNVSATNKLFFHWIHDNPSVFLSAEGVGSGGLRPTIRLQNVADSREYLYPNVVSGVELKRGQWHHWEYVFIANTPGSANGVVRWWLDGVLVGEYTNVKFSGSGQSNIWQYYSLNPIWGGVDGSVQSSMNFQLDHVYLSGAR